jgi:hypothetical protein
MKHPDMTIVVRNYDHRTVISKFISAHAVDPALVPIPNTIKIEDGRVTFEQVECHPDGTMVWDGDHAKIHTVTADLVAPWPLPVERYDWGYRYYDTRQAYCGPMTEEAARQKVSEDLSRILLRRRARDLIGSEAAIVGGWEEVDTDTETPAVEVEA